MLSRVGDHETLFRSVDGDPAKKHWARDEDNVLRVSSAAFMDPGFKPSVDRAAICCADPTWTRRRPGDGVVRLGVGGIRAIHPARVSDQDAKGHVAQERRVDVVPDPVGADQNEAGRANPAHALVITTPQITANKGAWGRVRAALAFVANEHGWAREPGG